MKTLSNATSWEFEPATRRSSSMVSVFCPYECTQSVVLFGEALACTGWPIQDESKLFTARLAGDTALPGMHACDQS